MADNVRAEIAAVQGLAGYPLVLSAFGRETRKPFENIVLSHDDVRPRIDLDLSHWRKAGARTYI